MRAAFGEAITSPLTGTCLREKADLRDRPTYMLPRFASRNRARPEISNDCDGSCSAVMLTGKLVTPVALTAAGRDMTSLGGVRNKVSHELVCGKHTIANMGNHVAVDEPDELEEVQDRGAFERKLLEFAIQRQESCVVCAVKRLADSRFPDHLAPGNDDDFDTEKFFENNKVFRSCEDEVVQFGELELATTGWSQTTPWKTPRECIKDELQLRLRKMADALY